MIAPRRTHLIAWTAVSLIACGGPDAGGSHGPAPTVATVRVTPQSLALPIGGTTQLTAEPQDGSGVAVPGATVAWLSDAPAVASVSQTGTVTGVSAGTTTVRATSEGQTGTVSVTVEDSYDLDALGPPRLIEHDYIDLAAIARISRFRSGIGHDYSDDAETCRSMKHYFQPRSDVDWSAIEVFSPVQGTITEVQMEQTAGLQVRIRPAAVPAATVIIFHVNPDAGMIPGRSLAAGERLGTHIGSVTMSDVAVWLTTPGGRRLVSYFDVMPDDVFAEYLVRGVPSRDALVIGRSERDAAPLQCAGESFQDPGSILNWVDLS